jgi:hypothetical protein
MPLKSCEMVHTMLLDSLSLYSLYPLCSHSLFLSCRHFKPQRRNSPPEKWKSDPILGPKNESRGPILGRQRRPAFGDSNRHPTPGWPLAKIWRNRQKLCFRFGENVKRRAPRLPPANSRYRRSDFFPTEVAHKSGQTNSKWGRKNGGRGLKSDLAGSVARPSVVYLNFRTDSTSLRRRKRRFDVSTISFLLFWR